MDNFPFLIVAVVCAAFYAGCGDRRSVDVPTDAESVSADGQPRFSWYRSSKSDANQIVIVRMTIPGVFTDSTVEIPVARYMRSDSQGEMLFPPNSGRIIRAADGHNKKGGFGFVGGVNVLSNESDDDSITFEVHYSWTTPEQLMGEIDEKVAVKVGDRFEAKFPHGSRIHVSWRPAKPL